MNILMTIFFSKHEYKISPFLQHKISIDIEEKRVGRIRRAIRAWPISRSALDRPKGTRKSLV